jgi:hypothetical protein
MLPICRLALPLLVAAVLASYALIPVAPAGAQERFERRSVIEMLFGPRRILPEKTSRQPESVIRRPSKSKSRKRKSSSSNRQAEKVEKIETARKILVIGDFMAKALSQGLQTAFKQSPGVVVLRQTNGSSGLVRDDFYDWPGNLPAILDDIQPSIAIVMVGSNDRQPLRAGRKRIAVRTDAWVSEYTKRVEELARAVRSRNIPLLWVSAPAYKSRSMSTDILAINGIFRTVVGDVQGEFVDIWDGFVDEQGKFIYTGSDIKGQQVRLRTSDGIRMTKAGRRKLAFYVEKSVRRLLGDDAAEDVATLGEDNLPELIMLHPDQGDQIVRTRPIEMNDPAMDGATALLGAEGPPLSLGRTPRDDLVFDGKTTAAPPGRADYFVWPPNPDL